MTQTEFAEFLGVRKGAITNALRDGRLKDSVVKDGRIRKIKLKEGIDEFREKTNFKYSSKKAIYEPTEKEEEAAAAKGTKTPPTYSQSRAYREAFTAKAAELDYKKRIGQLVEIEDVKKEVFELARTARNLLLTIPNRVAARIVSMEKPEEVSKVLTEEIREALFDVIERAESEEKAFKGPTED